MLYDVEAKSHDQAFERLESLHRILQQDFSVVVVSCESLLDYFMPPADFQSHQMLFQTGKEIHLQSVISRLTEMGYEREEQVEGPGQFAVRGGILDIFPIHYQKPVRIELFDIEIDSIRQFDVKPEIFRKAGAGRDSPGQGVSPDQRAVKRNRRPDSDRTDENSVPHEGSGTGRHPAYEFQPVYRQAQEWGILRGY